MLILKYVLLTHKKYILYVNVWLPIKSVPLRVRKTRTVAEALVDHSWVSDIIGALSWHGLMEYLELWDAVSDFQLNNTEDQHTGSLKAQDFFPTRSAYRVFFVGAIHFEPWKLLEYIRQLRIWLV